MIKIQQPTPTLSLSLNSDPLQKISYNKASSIASVINNRVPIKSIIESTTEMQVPIETKSFSIFSLFSLNYIYSKIKSVAAVVGIIPPSKWVTFQLEMSLFGFIVKINKFYKYIRNNNIKIDLIDGKCDFFTSNGIILKDAFNGNVLKGNIKAKNGYLTGMEFTIKYNLYMIDKYNKDNANEEFVNEIVNGIMLEGAEGYITKSNENYKRVKLMFDNSKKRLLSNALIYKTYYDNLVMDKKFAIKLVEPEYEKYEKSDKSDDYNVLVDILNVQYSYIKGLNNDTNNKKMLSDKIIYVTQNWHILIHNFKDIWDGIESDLIAEGVDKNVANQRIKRPLVDTMYAEIKEIHDKNIGFILLI